MAKIRIYELAKTLKIPNKDLLAVIRDLGIDVKNHMSVIDEKTAGKITAAAVPPPAKKKKTVKKAAAAPAKKAAAPKKPAPGKKAAPARKTAAKPAATPAKVPPKAKARPAKSVTSEPAPATRAKAPAKPKPKAPAKAKPAPKAPAARRKPAPETAPPEPAAEPKPAPAPVPAPAPAPPPEPAPPREIELSEGITVKDLAERLGLKVSEIIKRLMSTGTMATVNQFLDFETARDVAVSMGYIIRAVALEDEGQEHEDEDAALVPRAPVVTIMGHVDHGKTSLLDAIRESSIINSEHGGITQHIGAYNVPLPGGSVVFLDTPGHEAFTSMRSRGAKITDIVVLVVAADDGVMPQTIEAIDHAKAAEVPIIVAVNKIDKPGANPETVKTQLAGHNLTPEDWGGQTIFCEVSAKQRVGLDNLLEMLLLQAEIMELTANPAKPCRGTVVESKLDRGRGSVATVLVQDGTLHVGDYFVTGVTSGKVRAILDEKGKNLSEALPSTPVEVLGLSGVTAPGDSFQVVPDERKARQIVALRQQKTASPAAPGRAGRVTLQDLFSKISQGEVKELPLVVKGDVQGSVEALSETLEKLSTEAVKVNVIHRGVGTINEGDILLASASNAVIIGFNVRPEPKVTELAARESVDMRFYNVIYKATEDIKKAMVGLLEPTFREEVIGRAEVRELFQVPRVGTVGGCGVTDGKFVRNAEARVLRDGIVLYTGRLGSLRRFKDDVKEVTSGYECGISIENFNDLKKGDVIEAFIQVEEQPTL